jgi:hypothetical protein
MKKCSKCKEVKTLDQFYKDPKITTKPRAACKACYIQHRNTVGKNRQLKKRYGITVEDYNNLFEFQKGCCAICRKHQSQLNVSLAVDHDHANGNIRGLLCFNCNSGLGRFKDNTDLLINAIKYLTRGNNPQHNFPSCPR